MIVPFSTGVPPQLYAQRFVTGQLCIDIAELSHYLVNVTATIIIFCLLIVKLRGPCYNVNIARMLLCKEDKSCKMTYNILLTIQAQGPYRKLQNTFFPQRDMTQEGGGWAIHPNGKRRFCNLQYGQRKWG